MGAPRATVVVGILLTATALTLVQFPAVYALADRPPKTGAPVPSKEESSNR